MQTQLAHKEFPLQAWVRQHQLISFFDIAYAIAFGVLFGYIFLRPGTPLQSWSLVWFLFAFSPTISAVFVCWFTGGMSAVKRLLSGFTRWKVNLLWYLAAMFLLLGPLAIALVYIAMGNSAAGLAPGITIPALLGTVLFQFFSGPISEEAGWRGFALPRLESRFSALVSSLILGVLWACWHIPLFFLTGATQVSIPFPIYLFLVLILTIYMTWLYNNTDGSLIITTLAHVSFNLTGVFITGAISLMPAMGFYLTAGPLLFLAVIGVVIIFGPKSLSKKPASELPYQRI